MRASAPIAMPAHAVPASASKGATIPGPAHGPAQKLHQKREHIKPSPSPPPPKAEACRRRVLTLGPASAAATHHRPSHCCGWREARTARQMSGSTSFGLLLLT
jgi:hypothetical protein